jgi:hypothetical protein
LWLPARLIDPAASPRPSWLVWEAVEMARLAICSDLHSRIDMLQPVLDQRVSARARRHHEPG